MTDYYIKLPLSGDSTTADLLGAKYVRTTRFISIGSGTSGSVTLPSGAEVVLDDFGGTVDAVVSGETSGKPNLSIVTTAAGAIVSATFDSSGNYTLSGTPSAYPVSLLYRVRQTFLDFDSDSSNIFGIPTISDGVATLNTLTHPNQTFATGTSGTDFNISSATSTHTFNIPDASTANRGLITTGSQEVTGQKTFGGTGNTIKAIFKAGAVPATDLIQFQNTSATVFGGITSDFRSYWGGASVAGKSHYFTSPSGLTASQTLTTRAIASQTGNLLTAENSAGTIIAGVNVNGQVYGALGSAAATSFCFINAGTVDNNTGLFSTGADAFSGAVGGTEAFRINTSSINLWGNLTSTSHSLLSTARTTTTVPFGTRQITSQTADNFQSLSPAGAILAGLDVNNKFFAQQGTAAAPGYFFITSGSTKLGSTGMYSSANNVVDFSTSGTQRFSILSTGQLNIGGNFTDTQATLQVTARATTEPNLTLKNIASQSVDALRVTTTANAIQAGITFGGRVFTGDTAAASNTQLYAKSSATSTVNLKLTKFASQTADIINFTESDGTSIIGRLTSIGILRLPSGTVSAPPYSFESDSTSGIYQSSGNVIDFTTASTRRANINDRGLLTLFNAHENTSANGGPSNPEVRSGDTFVPTPANLSNLTGVTIEKVNWMRVGNVVTVSGYGQLDDVVSGTTVLFELDNPVTSGIDSATDIGGSGAAWMDSKPTDAIMIFGNVANQSTQFKWFTDNGAGSKDFSFTYTYVVE